MNSRGYIGTGVACALASIFFFAVEASNDDLQAAIEAAGGQVSTTRDTVLLLLAVALLVAAAALTLVGIIGLGVKAGRRDQRLTSEERYVEKPPSEPARASDLEHRNA